MTMPVEMDAEVAKMLAMDVAAGFFDETQLCVRHNITPDQLDVVKRDVRFQRMADEYKRLMQDGGVEFRIKARQYALDVLRSMKDLALDVDQHAMARVKAASMVFELGGIRLVGDKGAVPMQLVINTNLALGAVPGQYSVEAKGVTIEHQN